MKQLIIVGIVLAALITGGFFVGVVRAASACRGEQGWASWYSYTGRPTASGAPYTVKAMTAAHRSMPFGCIVRVVDMATGKSVVVRIDDRGPWVRGRVIDAAVLRRSG